MSGMYSSAGDLIVTLDGEAVASDVRGQASGTAATLRLTDAVKTAQADAVANAAALTVWTPVPGKRPRLLGFAVGSSAGGRVAVRVGSAVVARLRVPANQTVAVALGANGYLAATADDVVDVLNATGGPADLDAVAWGTEE